MPEGHTVHRLARTFNELFRGEAVLVSSPQGRFAEGASRINQLPLAHAQAWGKQMFLGFGARDAREEDLLWLRVHLGLYGSWTFAGDTSVRVAHAIGAPRKRIGEQEKVLSDDQPAHANSLASDEWLASGWEVPQPRGQVRVRLLGSHAVADLTGPTACEVLTWPDALKHIRKLGPDPIRDDADPEEFISKVVKKKVAIGQLLMDQSVIAGVGNIYRAEALFRARLSPFTLGHNVTRSTVQQIWNDLVVLMRDGVRTGAIVTTDPDDRLKGIDPLTELEKRAVTRQNTDGAPGSVPREESFYVYHRHGQPCRVCGTSISLTDMQARKLYWCANCQK